MEEGGIAETVTQAPFRRRPRRLSQVFAAMASHPRERVSVSDILDALGNRSFAALLVFFAAINLLPLPPGSSAVLGLPLLIVSAQLMVGSRRAWLPAFVATRSLSAEQFRGMLDRLLPRLVQVEQWITPRYWPFWRRQGDRVIGIIAFILSVVVTLPIPLGNWLPACSIALLGLALSERDGIFFGAGCLVAVVAFTVITLVFGAAGLAAEAAIGYMF